MFNISTRKVGGLRFIKIGRITISFCVSRRFKPIKDAKIVDVDERRLISRVINGRRVFVVAQPMQVLQG